MFYVTARPRLGRSVYTTTKNQGYRPKANVIESKEDYKLFLAVPGLTKEDLTIRVDKDVLTIRSEKDWDNGEENQWSRKEFVVKQFERNFTLPEEVDTNKIEATVEHGLLKVVLGKREAAIVPPARTIAIA